MAEPFNKIASPVPLSALAGVRLQYVSVQKQKLPSRDDGPEAEWESKLIGRHGITHRRPAHQESVDRTDVRIRRMREMIIGECRVKLPPFPIDAVAHGALERLLRP